MSYLKQVGFILFFFSPITLNAQLKPGDIHPNAKVLEVDELFPFSDGVARIRRGTSYALIDASGNLVVPFNKWIILSNSKANLINVSEGDRTKIGLINSNGKLLVPCGTSQVTSFKIDKDGFAFVSPNPPKTQLKYFINSKGERIDFADKPGYSLSFDFSEGLSSMSQLIVSQKGNVQKLGYINHKGQMTIAAQFEKANEFSEGLALVGNKNEFGEMKYGFIDKSGKVVIPLQFTIPPSNFKSGLAFIDPVIKDDFRFAYINKEGKIVFKINKDPNGKDLYSYGNQMNLTIKYAEFRNGYSEWRSVSITDPINKYLIDTTGHLSMLNDLLKFLNIDVSKLYTSPDLHNDVDGKLILYGKNGQGILDLKRKKVLPFIYMIGEAILPYDPISKLTLTKSKIQNENKLLEGYINEDGIYVIIKGQGSKF